VLGVSILLAWQIVIVLVVAWIVGWVFFAVVTSDHVNLSCTAKMP
jgi:hypothetical protein